MLGSNLRIKKNKSTPALLGHLFDQVATVSTFADSCICHMSS